MTASPTVLVATWREGLFAVRPGAVELEIPEGEVAGLASDGAGGALAIVGGKSLCRRSAEGQWMAIGTGPRGLSCCTALGDAVFVGTDDARVLRLEPGGGLVPLAGFDDVAGRETWYAGTALVEGRVVGPPLGVRSMCATSDHSTLLVNVHVGGIPRSTDAGETWKPTIDIECDVHQVCAHPARPELVAAATAVGLAISRDGGETWTTEHEGLHATHCTAVAFVGGDILVSASTDQFTKDGAIYRRPIEGRGPLRRVDGGLPQWLDGIADTGNIAARGDCVAVADSGGHLYLSHDRGATWERIAEQLPFPTGVLLC
ncbi:hypothetical protein WMF30_52715 [Sorangium sp. So ce134]